MKEVIQAGVKAVEMLRNIANSKGGQDIGTWLDQGSAQLMNIALNGSAAPVYAHNQPPGQEVSAEMQQVNEFEQQQRVDRMETAQDPQMQELGRYELSKRFDRMDNDVSNGYDKHNEMSAARDAARDKAMAANQAIDQRNQEHQPQQERGMSK